ncbi:hypothetical protein HDU99_000657, partial [Rhizoclosmatium hyalinum]
LGGSTAAVAGTGAAAATGTAVGVGTGTAIGVGSGTVAATTTASVLAAAGPILPFMAGALGAGILIGVSCKPGFTLDWSCWKKCLCCSKSLEKFMNRNEGIFLNELLDTECIQGIFALDDRSGIAIRNHMGQVFQLDAVYCPVTGALLGLHAEEVK